MNTAGWVEFQKGIWKCVIVPKFVCAWVLTLSDGFMIRINGTEVQKTYASLEEAKIIAIKAVEKLNLQLTKELKENKW